MNRIEEEILVADLILKRKQVSWETPKNVAILCVAMATIMTALVALATYVGVRIGQATPPQQIIVTLPQLPPAGK
jgi:hypothetical protein